MKLSPLNKLHPILMYQKNTFDDKQKLEIFRVQNWEKNGYLLRKILSDTFDHSILSTGKYRVRLIPTLTMRNQKHA